MKNEIMAPELKEIEKIWKNIEKKYSLKKPKNEFQIPIDFEKGEISQFLDGFMYGANAYYKHFTKMIYTDGVSAFAEKYNAVWLLNAIFSHACEKVSIWDDFNIVGIHVKNKRAMLVIARDLDEEEQKYDTIRARQFFRYADLPDGFFKFYFENRTLCLPTEW